MQISDIDLITLLTALIKDGRYEEASDHIKARKEADDKNPHLYSLEGMLKTTSGDFLAAIPCFLYAYAASRNRFYLNQLEEVLSKYYPEHVPFVLNSLDYMSFFKERSAKLTEAELKSITRQFPDLRLQASNVFPSTLFEEVFADRGLWCAEDRDLNVLYARDYHSLPATDGSFLIDKMHEIPPTPSDLFPGVNTAEGTLGIQSVHIGARSMLCRKSMLSVHRVDEECVYIGGSPNIGHFLHDFLPKAEIWANIKGQLDLPIYTYNISGFCREMTDALFPDLRFIDLTSRLPDRALLHFRHAHVPSYVPAGFAFPLLRERAERFGHMKPKDGAGDLVYLARGKDYRRITNEDALVERLRKLGFAIIDTMETPFAEIIAIMSNARLIVGGYGAHTSYIVFCKPGTEYVELLPDAYADTPMLRFNDRIYTYSHVRGRKLRCPTEFAGIIGNKADYKYSCDIDAIEQEIRKSATAAGVTLDGDISLAG